VRRELYIIVFSTLAAIGLSSCQSPTRIDVQVFDSTGMPRNRVPVIFRSSSYVSLTPLPGAFVQVVTQGHYYVVSTDTNGQSGIRYSFNASQPSWFGFFVGGNDIVKNQWIWTEYWNDTGDIVTSTMWLRVP